MSVNIDGWNTHGGRRRGQDQMSVDLPLNIATIQMPLLLVVVVHRVHDVLLPVLDNLPDGASDHVTRRQGSDHQTLALPLEADWLAVLELGHLLEAGVHLVQGEQGELLNIVTGLEFSDILVQVNSEKFTASILLTVLVSALWEMFFTYIQKQNWLKSHHIQRITFQ